VRRRRSCGWWVVVSLVCFAMGAFLVFDVLDLDGSRRETGTPLNTLVAEAANPEIERALYPAPDTPRSSGDRMAILQPFLRAASPPTVPTSSSGMIQACLHAVRPRLHTERIQHSPACRAGDPA